MPYCPKCDMEFVDGITTCSDCGGDLVESQEAYEAEMREKKKQQQIDAASGRYQQTDGIDASEILDNLIVLIHRHQNGQCIKGHITPNLRHFRKCR